MRLRLLETLHMVLVLESGHAVDAAKSMQALRAAAVTGCALGLTSTKARKYDRRHDVDRHESASRYSALHARSIIFY
jgi:hypothetical protein